MPEPDMRLVFPSLRVGARSIAQWGSVIGVTLTGVGTALAQVELPPIDVSPAPSPGPSPTTTRPPTPPTTTPVPAAPTPPRDPGLIDRDKIPSNIETLTPRDFEPTKALSVPDALMRRVPSVFITDTAGN